MGKHLIQLPDRQTQQLKVLSGQTELSMREIVRRILDWGMQEPALNTIIPAMSGQLRLE